jgi:hypothetical protein
MRKARGGTTRPVTRLPLPTTSGGEAEPRIDVDASHNGVRDSNRPTTALESPLLNIGIIWIIWTTALRSKTFKKREQTALADIGLRSRTR